MQASARQSASTSPARRAGVAVRGSRRRRPAAAAAAAAKDPPAGRAFDVLGVGQALVDMQFTVDDGAGVLARLGVDRGGRRVVSPAERERFLEDLRSSSSSSFSDGDGGNGGGGSAPRVSAGGSLANTLVGLARLGRASGRPLRVAMGGSVGGDDALGALARGALRAAGVTQVSPPPPPASPACARHETGTVIVVTTRSDAQRSFLACFPPDASLERENRAAEQAAARAEEKAAAAAATSGAEAAAADAAAAPSPTSPLRAAARDTGFLALEGYVFELPGAAEALPALAALARASGARVALAAGDAGVVRRHRAAFAAVLRAGVDVLLANAEEAEELLEIARAQPGDGGNAPPRPPARHAAGASSAAASSPAAAPRAEAAARELSAACGGALVSVTDGSRGAYIACAGRLAVVPPCWSREAPVDTTGAGDAYAAGLLWSLLSQRQEEGAGASGGGGGGVWPPDLHALGAAARRAAAAVIARVGPALTEEDAARVVAAGLPAAATAAAEVVAPLAAAVAAAPAPAHR